MSATQLILVRHGESGAQVAGRFSGHSTCTGLSDLGRTQALALRDRLLKTSEFGPIDAVYTSILPRAIETAKIIAPALGDIAPHAECNWCEIHAGDAEGERYDDFFKKYPRGNDPEDPFRRRFTGGETWAECYVRIGTRLGRIAAEHPDQTVVVVAHGGTIGASFVALGNQPMRSAFHLTHEAINTSITQWRWNGTDWRLARFNDAGHLANLSFGEL
jgi:probable phosphoglycerate mutase